MFSQPGLYTPWAVQPLSVAYSPDRFAKCEMSASLLSNDQVGPVFLASALGSSQSLACDTQSRIIAKEVFV